MPTHTVTRRLFIGIAVPLMILVVLASGPVRSEPVVEPPVAGVSVSVVGAGADRLLP